MTRITTAMAMVLAAALTLGTATAQSPPARTGEEIFLTVGCAGCHGADGGGRNGPRLAGMAILNDATFVVRQILTGSAGSMPSFRNRLTDAEIAALVNFLRTNWGPAAPYAAVTTAEVEAIRARR